eukprot:3208353-Pleurochrysis_carterae.AAC.1
MSSHADRASTPPSPACATMSASGQRSAAAAARSAAHLSCRAPGKVVWRVERAAGTHRRGSLQPRIWPRAHRGISSCSITTVGTEGTSTSSPRALARSAAVAASADANHASTLPAYTPGRKRSRVAMSPSGRMSSPSPGAASPRLLPSRPRGSGLRGRSRLRLPCDSVGCGVRRLPGSALSISAALRSGAMFRSDAKAGGVARAASMRARIVGVNRGPSVTRPPSTSSSVGALRAARASAAPAISASTRASFMSAGYAAAAAARAVPRASLPCATSTCPRVPCLHRAARKRRTCASMSGEKASVVYFRAGAPNAHCARVRKCARPASSAACILG